LKTYQIVVNGQEYTVAIDDPNASPVKVTVNGKPFEVTVSQQGMQATGKPTRSDASGATSEDLMLGTYVPTVASTHVEVAPEPEATDTQKPAAQAPSEGEKAVTAPMPGTILDIAVKVGDVVQQGDMLCNLEAMKMKSPIRSPSEGAVAQVLISEGQNVGYGDVLFTIG
jgi:biotin carboxyl carrier protein